ncbi:hypothetical protein D3C71_1666970 [compost metagenome]
MDGLDVGGSCAGHGRQCGGATEHRIVLRAHVVHAVGRDQHPPIGYAAATAPVTGVVRGAFIKLLQADQEGKLPVKRIYATDDLGPEGIDRRCRGRRGGQ